MKAHRTAGGDIVLFRPRAIARRLQQSAKRMVMAPTCSWPPSKRWSKSKVTGCRKAEGSLYLRPFMFASEAFLGVRPPLEYIFCVIASPVGPHLTNGDSAVTVWISDEYSRAASGGTGAAKCGRQLRRQLACPGAGHSQRLRSCVE